jgi:hypothetical protein
LSFWLTKLQKMRKRWMTTQWMMKIEDVGTILITLDYDSEKLQLTVCKFVRIISKVKSVI